MTTLITLINDFHSTSVNVRAQAGDILSESQMRRVKRALCNSPECRCGVVRGGQYALSEQTGYTDHSRRSEVVDNDADNETCENEWASMPD